MELPLEEERGRVKEKGGRDGQHNAENEGGKEEPARLSLGNIFTGGLREVKGNY